MTRVDSGGMNIIYAYKSVTYIKDAVVSLSRLFGYVEFLAMAKATFSVELVYFSHFHSCALFVPKGEI